MSHSSPIVQLPGVAGATCAPSAWKDYLDYLYDSTDTASPVSVCSYNSTGAQSLSPGYWGGSFSPTQGKIYLSPHVAGTTGVWCSLDLLDGTVGPYTHGTSGLVGLAPYMGSVWSPKQDQIFFTPCSQHSSYHYVDCRTGKVAGFGITGASSTFAYYGGAYDPHSDKIWLPPALGATGSSWPAIDCSQKKLEWYPSGATGIQFDKPAYHGAVYSPSQRRVYYVPRWQVYNDTWHYVDCQSSSIVSYKHGVTGAGFSGLQYAGGAYDPVNDRIYLVPCTHNGTSTWHYIDCKGGSVVGYQPGTSGLPVGGLFREGVYSPLSRRLYLSPYQEAGATGVWYYLDTGTNKLCSYAAPKASAGLSYYSGVFAPGVNRVYFSPGSQSTQSTWHYIQETCGVPVPLDLGYSVAHLSSPQVSFLCIDEAEVSMLCVDGTDGKGGVYQLTTVFQDGVSRNAYCAWSSSDHSVATVSSSGLVTAVSNGGAALGKDVIITATYGAKTSSCLITVYQTMPSAEAKGEGMWLLKGGRGAASFRGDLNLAAPLASTSLDILMLSSTLAIRSTWYVGNDMPEGCASTGLLAGYFDLIWANSSSSHCRFRCGNFLVADSIGKRMTLEFLSATQEDYNACGGYYPAPSNARCRVLRDGTPGSILTGGRAASYNNIPRPIAWDTWDVSLSCRFSGSIGRNLSEFYELSLPARCDAFYYAQNYVRYADRASSGGIARSNYTRIPNIGTLGSAYDLSCNNVPVGWFASNAPEFLCIDEAEVSMLCVDGTDGKDGEYQLHAVFTWDTTHNTWVTWSSSDPSVATVDSSGLVTAVSNGGAPLGKDVTITATYNGKTSSCLITVYQTMPSADVEGEGLWVCKGGKGQALTGKATALCCFSVKTPTNKNARSSLYVGSVRLPSNYLFSPTWLSPSTATDYNVTVNLDASLQWRPEAAIVSGGSRALYMYSGAPSMGVSGGLATISQIATASCLLTRTATYVRASTLLGSESSTVSDTYTHYVYSYLAKEVLSGISTEEVTEYSTARGLYTMLYSPQNYVRYADRASSGGIARSNYTRIPNIGTLGSTYDLSANNVPAGWFSV